MLPGLRIILAIVFPIHRPRAVKLHSRTVEMDKSAKPQIDKIFLKLLQSAHMYPPQVPDFKP